MISTENSCFAFVLKGRVTGVYLIIVDFIVQNSALSQDEIDIKQ